ncbi:unnamed protein product [Amoebophrya sp. A120]|nr:unnamed protein product [Amoebophrya sp. A120]|eukprot:GSA120T00019463001.1
MKIPPLPTRGSRSGSFAGLSLDLIDTHVALTASRPVVVDNASPARAEVQVDESVLPVHAREEESRSRAASRSAEAVCKTQNENKLPHDYTKKLLPEEVVKNSANATASAASLHTSVQESPERQFLARSSTVGSSCAAGAASSAFSASRTGNYEQMQETTGSDAMIEARRNSSTSARNGDYKGSPLMRSSTAGQYVGQTTRTTNSPRKQSRAPRALQYQAIRDYREKSLVLSRRESSGLDAAPPHADDFDQVWAPGSLNGSRHIMAPEDVTGRRRRSSMTSVDPFQQDLDDDPPARLPDGSNVENASRLTSSSSTTSLFVHQQRGELQSGRRSVTGSSPGGEKHDHLRERYYPSAEVVGDTKYQTTSSRNYSAVGPPLEQPLLARGENEGDVNEEEPGDFLEDDPRVTMSQNLSLLSPTASFVGKLLRESSMNLSQISRSVSLSRLPSKERKIPLKDVFLVFDFTNSDIWSVKSLYRYARLSLPTAFTQLFTVLRYESLLLAVLLVQHQQQQSSEIFSPSSSSWAGDRYATTQPPTSQEALVGQSAAASPHSGLQPPEVLVGGQEATASALNLAGEANMFLSSSSNTTPVDFLLQVILTNLYTLALLIPQGVSFFLLLAIGEYLGSGRPDIAAELARVGPTFAVFVALASQLLFLSFVRVDAVMLGSSYDSGTRQDSWEQKIAKAAAGEEDRTVDCFGATSSTPLSGAFPFPGPSPAAATVCSPDSTTSGKHGGVFTAVAELLFSVYHVEEASAADLASTLQVLFAQFLLETLSLSFASIIRACAFWRTGFLVYGLQVLCNLPVVLLLQQVAFHSKGSSTAGRGFGAGLLSKTKPPAKAFSSPAPASKDETAAGSMQSSCSILLPIWTGALLLSVCGAVVFYKKLKTIDFLQRSEAARNRLRKEYWRL